MMDLQRYPTEDQLERISSWQIQKQSDLDALWAFCKELWFYPDRFVPMEEPATFWTDTCDWYLSTGGWSGNEDIVDALRHNDLFWILCWRVSRAGGHYGFRIANRVVA